MEELEKQMMKLDKMFEEGKSISTPHIVATNYLMKDLKGPEPDSGRKDELLRIRDEQEAELLKNMQKEQIRINKIKNFLGTINQKAINKLKDFQDIIKPTKEEVKDLVENMDEKVKMNTTEQPEDDNVLNSETIPKINFSKCFLIDIPRVILDKLRNQKRTNENDEFLFNLEKEQENKLDITEQKSRTLKKNGSVFSSILLTIVTTTIGIIAALLLLK